MTPDQPTCARCGHPRHQHQTTDGQWRQGYQASRFTGHMFCDGHRLSGGPAGMLQTCGCQGWQDR